MLEWPEIEHYRTQLSPLICGQRIDDVSVASERVINEPIETFRDHLIGRTILFLERRGKSLLLHLDDGNRLLLQLLAGSWLVYGSDSDDSSTAQVKLHLSRGDKREVLLCCGKRHSHVHRLSAKIVHELFKTLGPEPFDPRLTPVLFRHSLLHKKSRLKTALADQRLVAGIGNRYADEICYEAKLHPDRMANSLQADESDRLLQAIRHILQAAKDAGGCNPHRLIADDLIAGGYIDELQVYEREGKPCNVCGNPIMLLVHANRKNYLCPHCQGEA